MIFFIIDSLQIGGKEKQLINLVEKIHHNFKIITFEANFSITNNDKIIDNIIVIKRKNNYDLITFAKLFLFLKKKSVIVHAWDSVSAFYAAIISKFNKKLVLINGSIRTSQYSYSQMNLLTNFRIKFTIRNSNYVVANSFSGLESLGLEPSKKNKVIYNGITDYHFTNKNIRKDLKINENSIIVAMVANFTKHKDYDSFFKAALELTKKNPNLHFLAIGDGTKIKYYLNTFKLESYQNIHLLGLVKNVLPIISNVDICVLTSNSAEGLSNSIMEYMLCGKPVIATNIGGNPELINNNYDGYLVSKKNYKELVTLIEKLVWNKDLRVLIGRRAQKKIISQFSINKMIKEYTDFYNNIMLTNDFPTSD